MDDSTRLRVGLVLQFAAKWIREHSEEDGHDMEEDMEALAGWFLGGFNGPPPPVTNSFIPHQRVIEEFLNAEVRDE